MLRCLALIGLLLIPAAVGSAADAPYDEIVAADQPLLWWRFEGDAKARLNADSRSAADLGPLAPVGAVKWGQPGPQPERYPRFKADNSAVVLSGGGAYLKLKDPGENSPLDFGPGDSLTLEAWISPSKLGAGQQVYILGKGRTKNPGVANDNQNYGLRVTETRGEACLSFLFREAGNRPGKTEDWHRWNSKTGCSTDGSWHHVAVSYTFGKPESIRGYIDGKPVQGTWDYGGATTAGPVVDDDELWIGSSMGGSAGSTFAGGIDEVAIYRSIVPPERMALRFEEHRPPAYATPLESVPQQGVLVEVMGPVPDKGNWDFSTPAPVESYIQPDWSLTGIRNAYNAHGIRIDRSNPTFVRLTGWLTLPVGKSRLMVRSRGASKVYFNGELRADIPFTPLKGDGHNPVPELGSKISQSIRIPQPGDREQDFEFTSDGKPILVTWEMQLGGKERRPEAGESLIAIERDGMFYLAGTAAPAPLTDQAWLIHAQQFETWLAEQNRLRRLETGREYAKFWEQRHDLARESLKDWPAPQLPVVSGQPADANPIDRFIGARLEKEEVAALPLTDDASFLRRTCLDVWGRIPPAELLAEVKLGGQPLDRARLIDRLLASPEWADHWVAYWQDVLAENPNIVNPTLNNTGPFRWWLHESFVDNKPFDRFATELVLMEGSDRYGGVGGFATASQNDAPMAAKAHIISQSFLALEMKCARCHDAPYHDFKQSDLFQLAALLKRGPEAVPKTSTVPTGNAGLAAGRVKVTLKPGESVEPEWPFADKISGELAAGLMQKPDDSREQFAAWVTNPGNRRFPQVIANRMWQRYLGRGLVEPVDDWENSEPSHPELLDFLARELVASGYDLKHLSRLILTSQTYQRQSDLTLEEKPERAELFAGPKPRRLSAEQVVDSLFTAAAKPFNTEELSIDVDGTRSYKSSISLGFPTRAWQFTSMSNERDRPSLSLPAAQAFVNVLETFGWRSSRPDPISVRPEETSVLQPAILANGLAGRRASQLSDDSVFTDLALTTATPEVYVDALYLHILTRRPTDGERSVMVDLLKDGFSERIAPGNPPIRKPGPPRTTGVSWSNHLLPEATERKLALARELEAGDPPTARLTADWRQRAEDCVWALLNSPEFLVIP